MTTFGMRTESEFFIYFVFIHYILSSGCCFFLSPFSSFRILFLPAEKVDTFLCPLSHGRPAGLKKGNLNNGIRNSIFKCDSRELYFYVARQLREKNDIGIEATID